MAMPSWITNSHSFIKFFAVLCITVLGLCKAPAVAELAFAIASVTLGQAITRGVAVAASRKSKKTVSKETSK